MSLTLFQEVTLAYTVLAVDNPGYLADNFTLLNVDVTARRSERNPSQVLVHATPRTEALKQSFDVRHSSPELTQNHRNLDWQDKDVQETPAKSPVTAQPGGLA